MSNGRKAVRAPGAHFRPLQMKAAPIYWSYATVTLALGLFMVLAPQDWFGATWHYFPQLPPDGFGMGVALIVIGAFQCVVLWKHPTAFLLSVLFAISAFVYWTAGCILSAAGILGGTGMASAPFILVIALHKFIHSASLMAYHREAKRSGFAPSEEPFTYPAPPVVVPVHPDPPPEPESGPPTGPIPPPPPLVLPVLPVYPAPLPYSRDLEGP